MKIRTPDGTITGYDLDVLAILAHYGHERCHVVWPMPGEWHRPEPRQQTILDFYQGWDNPTLQRKS